MKQLDPKAIWLFFINKLITVFVVVMIFGLNLGLFMLDIFGLGSMTPEGLGLSVAMSIILVIVAVCVICYVYAKLTFRFYRYEMADIVFKKEHGIIWKKYVSIPYDRIQNVDIHRGVFARLLGLSDLQIQTAGASAPSPYGAYSEGRLMGLSKEDAERLRDELILKARNSRTGQGL